VESSSNNTLKSNALLPSTDGEAISPARQSRKSSFGKASLNGYEIDPSSDYFTSDAPFRSKRPAIIMLLVGVLCFGSFLWLRMRLVADMPKQAYAEPESQRPAASDIANTPGNFQVESFGQTIPSPLMLPIERALTDSVPITINDASTNN